MSDEIFVFGSNTAGVHGKGAALHAAQHFGAERGVAEGRTGQAYAIPTRRYFYRRRIETLTLSAVACAVARFCAYAAAHPELTFNVTAIGTGLAGFTHEQIAPLFKSAPKNCRLPGEWIAILARGDR